jgi:hypothetical protein
MSGGRRGRMAGVLIVLALLLAGTFWGDDDNFPFGPFRMYSTKQELDGEVRATAVEGLTPDEGWIELPFEAFGLRRADVEGQLDRFARSPTEILAAMAVAYDRLNPDEGRFLAFRLREHTFDLENGLEAGETVATLGSVRIGD